MRETKVARVPKTTNQKEEGCPEKEPWKLAEAIFEYLSRILIITGL